MCDVSFTVIFAKITKETIKKSIHKLIPFFVGGKENTYLFYFTKCIVRFTKFFFSQANNTRYF